jgi:hypothetical protein
MLTEITFIDPNKIMTLSFGLILAPLLYFTLVKQFFYDRYSILILLSVYGTIYMLAAMKVEAGFYVAAIVYPLLFTSFILITKLAIGNVANKHNYIVLFLISVVSLSLYWHTAHMKLVFFVAGLVFISILINKLTNKKNDEIGFRNSLALLTFVISITFTQLWRSSYAHNFVQNVTFFDFIDKLIAKLFGGITHPIPYNFNYRSWILGDIYFNLNMLIHFISTLIIIISIGIVVYKIYINKNYQILTDSTLVFAVLFAQVIDVIAYYETGNMSFFYLPLFFPIFGLYFIIQNAKNISIPLNKLVRITVLLLIISSALMTVVMVNTNELGLTSVTQYHDTRTNYNWIQKNMNADYEIIADFNILGKYLQREASVKFPTTNYSYLTINSYSVLIGDNINSKLKKDYVVVDYQTMKHNLPIYTGTFKTRQVVPMLDFIKNSPSSNKLYMDNSISIYQFC